MSVQVAIDKSGTECLDHLFQLIRRGELLSKLYEDPRCIIGCIAQIVADLLHKDDDGNPVIGDSMSDTLRVKVMQLDEQLNGAAPASGPLVDALIWAAIERIVAKLFEMLREKLDD